MAPNRHYTSHPLLSISFVSILPDFLSHVWYKNNNPERLFFDLMVEDVHAEFDRIMSLGAKAIQEPYEFTDDEMKLIIATLADLDGNFFQLVSVEKGQSLESEHHK